MPLGFDCSGTGDDDILIIGLPTCYPALAAQNEIHQQHAAPFMTHKNDRSSIIREQFPQWCKPRRGTLNPEIMTNLVWTELVENRYSPHRAHKTYGTGDKQSPGWCFSRSGQSETRLADGTAIFIGGEHEDHYDKDFYIYNDVIVKSPDGQISIFGYSKDVFPPTDSHSATLVHDSLYIIGCIGYPEQRNSAHTPVYVLSLDDHSIKGFETSGTIPNGLYKHSARFVREDNAIYCAGGEVENIEASETVENITTWRLCLSSGVWTAVNKKSWSRWRLIREDNQANNLYAISRVLSAERSGREDKYSESYRAQLRKNNCPVDRDEYQSRYAPPIDHGVVKSAEFRTHKISIDGVIVRYDESSHDITVTVEGTLPANIIATLKAHGLATFSKLENTPYKIVEL